MTCESCGRKIPRNKGVSFERSVSFNTELRTANDVRFFERMKVYYCVSCAKHRGIFQKKKEQAMRRSAKKLV